MIIAMDSGILLGDVASVDRFSLGQLLRLGTVERPFGLALSLPPVIDSRAALATWPNGAVMSLTDPAKTTSTIDDYGKRYLVFG